MILGKYPKHDVELDLELGLALELDLELGLALELDLELRLALELDLELRLALDLKTLTFLRFFKLCHQKCQFRLGFGGVTSTLTR